MIKRKPRKECFKVRTDGRSVDIDGDYTETLARLSSNPERHRRVWVELFDEQYRYNLCGHDQRR